MKWKSLLNPLVYKKKNKEYEEFSKAEDYGKEIIKFLKPKIKNKVVLDVGCGNGKYAKILSPHTKKYVGIDISKEQLKLARKNDKKVKFVNCSAEKIPFSKKSFDVILSTWTISVIQGRKKKKKALKEMKRVLKDNGKIFIIENDSTGEFEKIRSHIKTTQKGIKWLKKQGFKTKKKTIYFRFKDINTAKSVFKVFYGKSISNKVKSKIIRHNILIFTNKIFLN